MLIYCDRNEARAEVGQALTDASAQDIIQIIQAHALLAVHLCDTCLVLEGHVHVDSAAALAIRIGLHQLRGTTPWTPPESYLDTIAIALPEPLDAVEEGERIRAFWTAFCFDRAYAVLLGVPSLIRSADEEDARIDTPWPLDMAIYEQVSLLFVRHLMQSRL